MGYTENERKAFERCNELIKDVNINWIGMSNQYAIKTLLNLLDKEQKENELSKLNLKNQYKIVAERNDLFEENKRLKNENSRLSIARAENAYGYENTYFFTEDKISELKKIIYKIEIERGKFVDVKELYNKYQNSIPKESIREFANFAIDSIDSKDEYSIGMCNGIIYLRSVILNEEPVYKKCEHDSIPKEAIREKMKELEKNKYYRYGESGTKYELLKELLGEWI